MPDRENVMSALDCRANDTDFDCRKCDYYIREDKPEYCDFRRMLRDAIALLKEEEVVRCKDCKHYRATPGYCAYDRIWQKNKGHVWGMYCKPDWFCADGERREGR